MSRFDDIMDMPAPEPKNHKRMPREKRAAQFAPFNALTGFGEEIDETEALIRMQNSDPGFTEPEE